MEKIGEGEKETLFFFFCGSFFLFFYFLLCIYPIHVNLAILIRIALFALTKKNKVFVASGIIKNHSYWSNYKVSPHLPNKNK